MAMHVTSRGPRTATVVLFMVLAALTGFCIVISAKLRVEEASNRAWIAGGCIMIGVVAVHLYCQFTGFSIWGAIRAIYYGGPKDEEEVRRR
jgi:hypothetical protein